MLEILLAEVELPETFEFLGLGWWIVHVVGIVVVFTLGCLYGQKYAAKQAPKPPPTSAPAEGDQGGAGD